MARLAFKEAWIADARAEFRKQLKETIETGKDKIVIEFLKQLDSLFRKKIEAFVNRTLENRDMFIKPVFWKELQREYESMIQLGSNNIRNKFEELGLGRSSLIQNRRSRPKSTSNAAAASATRS